MRRKKIIILMSVLVICLVIVFGVSAYRNANTDPDPEEMISKIEAAWGDEYKKQSMTELAATLTYGDTTNEENKIYYRILKTTVYEGNPDEVTGLHQDSLRKMWSLIYGNKFCSLRL